MRATLILSAALVFAACGKGSIFTDIDFSLKKLEDIYPGQYEKNRVEFVKGRAPKGLKFEKHTFGAYGSAIMLIGVECESTGQCKENWQVLVDATRQQKLSSYNQTKVHEYRFNYTAADEVRGIIWTNKRFLFHIEAKDDRHLRNFLSQSKIAKIQ